MYHMAMSASQRLTKITVNLNERAAEALASSAERDGETRTDIINRALQMYDWIGKEVARGSEVYLKAPTGSHIAVRFM